MKIVFYKLAAALCNTAIIRIARLPTKGSSTTDGLPVICIRSRFSQNHMPNMQSLRMLASSTPRSHARNSMPSSSRLELMATLLEG